MEKFSDDGVIHRQEFGCKDIFDQFKAHRTSYPIISEDRLKCTNETPTDTQYRMYAHNAQVSSESAPEAHKTDSITHIFPDQSNSQHIFKFPLNPLHFIIHFPAVSQRNIQSDFLSFSLLYLC